MRAKTAHPQEKPAKRKSLLKRKRKLSIIRVSTPNNEPTSAHAFKKSRLKKSV
jgi:hypothetical protein